MKISLLLSAVLVASSAAPAAARPIGDADREAAAYQRLIEQSVPLSASERERAAALADKAARDFAALDAEETAAMTRLKALNDSVYLKLSGLLDERHRGLIDPTAAVYNLDADFMPPLPAQARERGRQVYEAARPELERASAAVKDAARRQDERLAAFLTDALALAARAPADKRAEMETRLELRRKSRKLYGDLVFLADDPAVLGQAQRRVALVQRAQDQLVSPWMASWRAKDLPAFRRLLARGFRTSPWGDFRRARADASVIESRLQEGKPLAGKAALASVKAFLDRYQSVEGADLQLFGVEERGSRRVYSGLLSVRGRAAAGGRRQEATAAVKLTAVERGGTLALEGVELHGGKLVAAAKDALFVDRTAEAGLLDAPRYLRSESIRRGGYALALSAGHSGPASMYVGTVEGGLLLRQNDKGRFVDETRSAGLGDDRLVKSAIFADFNGDGREDLLVNHFQSDPSKALTLYEGREGGGFRPAGSFNFSSIARDIYRYPMTMAVGDFDGNRSLDLYVGFPGTMDFTTMRYEKTDAAPESQPQGLFLNQGRFRFKDGTRYALYGEATPGWLAFPHASVASDLDGDGKTDVLVVDDRKNPSTIYKNLGGGAFRESARRLGVWNAHWGMGAAVGDFKNGGTPDLYLTNVNFPMSFVMENDTAWLFGGRSASENSLGNHLYRNRGDGTFEDATDQAGLRFAGAAPACAASFDFDNDGRLDIYVANGLWSAGPEAKPFDATFLLASMAEHNLAAAGQLFGIKDFGRCEACAQRALSSVGEGGGHRKNAVLQALRYYKDESGRPLLSLGGPERNRLFHNNGDGTFTDVAYVAGVDSSADGYVAAVADFDHDGAMDLVLRNGDRGTTAADYPTLQLFVNEAGKEKASLTLRLTGAKGATDAIGAKVFVEQPSGLKQYRELAGNNGAAQDAKLLHFGLGDDALASRVVVRWPGGAEQSFERVLGGNYDLREGGRLERVEPDTAYKIGAR